jgi:DNA helicase IV
VNYRTPAEVMAVAADVLAEIDPGATPPASVRESGALPWRLAVDEADLAGSVAEAAASLAAEHAGDGTLAVIVPAGRLAELSAAVEAALPEVASPEPPDTSPGEADIDRPVVVLTVKQAKGLEFDSVVVADPGLILAESSRGLGDLYVALTRATQRVGVIHTGQVPPVLGRLAEAASVPQALRLASEVTPVTGAA